MRSRLSYVTEGPGALVRPTQAIPIQPKRPTSSFLWERGFERAAKSAAEAISYHCDVLRSEELAPKSNGQVQKSWPPLTSN